MSRLPYTPATVREIRRLADERRLPREIADIVGWGTAEVESAARKHGIELFSGKPVEVETTEEPYRPPLRRRVATQREPRAPKSLGRYAYISVALTPDVCERVREAAATRGKPVARLCGDIIEAAFAGKSK